MKNLTKKTLLTILTIISVKNTEWSKYPKTVQCFCGRRIRSDISSQLEFIKNKTIEYSSTLLNQYKDKFNKVIKNTNSKFPQIGDFEPALITITSSKERIPFVMNRYKSEFDFFTLYFYYGQNKNNFSYDFQIKPKQQDPDYIDFVTQKFNSNLMTPKKFLKMNKNRKYSKYYYTLDNLEDDIIDKKSKGGLSRLDEISKSRQLSHDMFNNYETDLCITFFIFMNKVVTNWKIHNDKLYKEFKTKDYKLKNKINKEFDREFVEKKESGGEEFVNLHDLVFWNVKTGKKDDICLKGQNIKFTSYESPKKLLQDRETSNFETNKKFIKTMTTRTTINFNTLNPTKPKKAYKLKATKKKKTDQIPQKQQLLNLKNDENKERSPQKHKLIPKSPLKTVLNLKKDENRERSPQKHKPIPKSPLKTVLNLKKDENEERSPQIKEALSYQSSVEEDEIRPVVVKQKENHQIIPVVEQKEENHHNYVSSFFQKVENINTYEIQKMEEKIKLQNRTEKVDNEEYEKLNLLKAEKLNEIQNLENSSINIYEGLYNSENNNFVEENGYKIFIKKGEFQTLENFVSAIKTDEITKVEKKQNYQILKIIDLEKIENFDGIDLSFVEKDILHLGFNEKPTEYNFAIEENNQNTVELKNLIEDLYQKIINKDYFLLFLKLDYNTFYQKFAKDDEFLQWLTNSHTLNSHGPNKLNWDFKKDIDFFLLPDKEFKRISEKEKKTKTREEVYIEIQENIKSKVNTIFTVNQMEDIKSLSNQDFLNFINNQRLNYLRKESFITELLKVLASDPDMLKKIKTNYKTIKNKAILENSNIKFTNLKIIIYSDLTIRTNFSFLHDLLIELFYQQNFIYYKELVIKEIQYEIISETKTMAVEQSKSIKTTLIINENDFTIENIQFPDVDPEISEELLETFRKEKITIINELFKSEGIPLDKKTRTEKADLWLSKLKRLRII